MDDESYRREVAAISREIGANERKLAELQWELDRLEGLSETRRAGLQP